MKIQNILPAITILFIGMISCKPSPLKIRHVHIQEESPGKANRKNPAQFISIAWSDLTETQIEAQLRDNLQSSYESFGDEDIIAERIIRNFMNRPEVKIPTRDSMLIDLRNFIAHSYKRFFNREATESEIRELEEKIEKDSTRQISPKTIWLGMMTSEEYKYY